MLVVLHWLIACMAPFYAVFGSSKYDELFLIFFLLLVLHWFFFNNECILSYLHKKTHDCNYKLGTIAGSTDLHVNGSNTIQLITGLFSIISVFYIVSRTKYDIKLLTFILTLLLTSCYTNKITADITQFASTILAIYLFRDNKYLLPGLILLLGSTLIVHHKDQNSCIRGTQIKKDCELQE
jgi:hypothetical protein